MPNNHAISPAVVAACLLLLPIGKSLADDDPREAAEYRALREAGKPNTPVLPNALGNAIAHVKQLRARTGANNAAGTAAPAAGGSPGFTTFSAAEAGTQGSVVTVGGVPVGEIAPPSAAAAPAPGGTPGQPNVPDPREGMLELNLTPLIPPAPLEAQASAAAVAAPGGIGPTRWNWLGPANIGGRVRSILIHPTRPNTMWLGAVSGGIWKTVDGGQSWAPLADFMASLNVSTMLLDPANPDVLFAGTGEGYYNFDAFRGAGMFRSVDGGATWEQMSGTASADFLFVNRLALSADRNTLYAATRTGLFRSTNFRTASPSAVIFSPVADVQGSDILQVACSTKDNNRCMASGYGQSVYHTADAGNTWQPSTGLPTNSGRIEITFAAADANIAYASVDNQLGEIYRSLDGGKTFTRQSTGALFLSTQGWYGNAIWAGDPMRPGLLIVGGMDLYRSLDGGATLTKISNWRQSPASAHADHHAIVAHPGYNGTTNAIVFFGNDGGIYRNDNILTATEQKGWVSLNHNFGVTQFYGVAGNPASGRIVAGTQDNGTLIYSPPPGSNTGPNGFVLMFGGDGGFTAADPTDPNIMYCEYTFLRIHRSIAGGAMPVPVYDGIRDAGRRDRALFVAPFILDPANSEAMLAGGASLWRSPNITAATPAWGEIKGPLPAAADGTLPLVSAIGASRSAPGLNGSDVIWVGYTDGQIYRTRDGLAGQPSWQPVSAGAPAPLPDRKVTRIRIDPNNTNTVYMAFAGYAKANLWRSLDGGASWKDISGGLPDVPVYDVAMHPRDSKLLYAASEVGVFASADGGNSWWPTNQGPANVAVNEFFWLQENLVAATHGRGLFWIDLSQVQLVAAATPASAAAASPALAAPANAPAGAAGRQIRTFIAPVSPVNAM